MALAQLGAVRRQNHRHMTKLRRLPAQCFVNQQLLRRIGKMLLSTQNMSHAHQMVIDNNSKVVGRHAVGFYDNKIIELVHIEGYVAMNQVMYGNRALYRNLHAHGIRLACSNTCLNLLSGQVAAGACIAERLLSGTLLFALCLKISSGAEAVVSLALFQQLVCIFFINIKTLGLIVRATVAAYLRAFIPVDAEPFQAGQNLTYRVLLQAFSISVLDTQNQLAAHLMSKQPVEQRSTRTTNM